MKRCLRCGAEARWLGDRTGRFWWICDGCGFEWDAGKEGEPSNLGMEYCSYNGTNVWREVPDGCLAVFGGEAG